jgi:hypothetical protein
MHALESLQRTERSASNSSAREIKLNDLITGHRTRVRHIHRHADHTVSHQFIALLRIGP